MTEERLIPRKLIQFWHDHAEMPQRIRDATEVTKANNPDHEIIFADDAFMQRFIEKELDEELLDIYRRIRIAAARSDFARALLLRAHGGFYIDAAMELQHSTDVLTGPGVSHVFFRRDLPPKVLDNCMMGAVAGSVIMEELVDLIVSNLRNRINNQSVWVTTGPMCVNWVMGKHDIDDTVRVHHADDLVSNGWIVYRRVEGVNNSWVEEQKLGIFRD